MAEFPVDPMLAKMIIQSEKYGVSGERGRQTDVPTDRQDRQKDDAPRRGLREPAGCPVRQSTAPAGGTARAAYTLILLTHSPCPLLCAGGCHEVAAMVSI